LWASVVVCQEKSFGMKRAFVLMRAAALLGGALGAYGFGKILPREWRQTQAWIM